MKTILVTGGAGFIGSNFIEYFLEKYPNYTIVNLDKLTYAGNISNLSKVSKALNYIFVQGDICDKLLVENLFKQYDFRGIIHFAAESHVDNSIESPWQFIHTNIEGTFTLLHQAKLHWLEAPYQVKEEYKECRFHHISTDEVYGSSDGLPFTEESAYKPNSPYSASKASSDMLVRAYHQTYGLNTVITHCSNNFGERQHSEKLIPVIINKALSQLSIPIYGDGQNIRDWLYVQDHCRAIDLVFHKGRLGQSYNIGGGNPWNNLALAQYICQVLDEKIPRSDGQSYQEQIIFVKDRLGHDRQYIVDFSKIQNELHWSPSVNFKEAIEQTILWYVKAYQQRK